MSMLFIASFSFSQQPVWRRAKGTEGIYITGMDVYRNDPDTLYAVGENLILRSTNRGESWDSIYSMGADIGALKVDPTDSKLVYTTWYNFSQHGNVVVRTTDGGETWKALGGTGFHPTVLIEIDPIQPNIVYIGFEFVLVRTTDRGESWQLADTLSGFPTAMAISPTNDSILYVIGTRGMFRSLDFGATWTQLYPPVRVQGATVAVDPENPKTVYIAAYGYGVYKSTDAGLTWIQKNNGLDSSNWFIEAIQVNPQNPEEVFFSTSTPVIPHEIFFRSTDAGDHWAPFTAGLPHAGHAGPIVIDTLNKRLYVGVVSFQRNQPDSTGIYILDEVTSVDPTLIDLPKHFILGQNYPNPFNPTTRIAYEIPTNGQVSIVVYDISGRRVVTLLDEIQLPGQYVISWDVNGLSSGVYFYQLKTENYVQRRKAILIK